MSEASPAPLRAAPAGEAALLIHLADEIGPAATGRVLRLTAALDAAALPGVVDRVPGYTTLLVVFDPEIVTAEALLSDLTRLDAEAGEMDLPAGRLVSVPVVYGGEYGPDLPDVAARLGLSEAEVAARHAGAEYRVACLGFVPGFAYLVGLPPELTVPRLPSPRPRVPVGAVGIGGSQTGVYAAETPGGWNLIGRSPLRPFDLRRADPFLFAAGDRVRFYPISASEYQAIAQSSELPALNSEPGERGAARVEEDHGDIGATGATAAHPGGAFLPERRDVTPAGTPAVATERRADIHVLAPGLLTTVQDLGRPHQLHHGVSLGGALDRAALILGNRLVGNDPGAAGLEITLSGPRLRFNRPCVVALTGADLGATLDGARLPRWEPVAIPAGGELAFRPELAAGRGARAYLCLAGGIDLPPVLGSRSTDLSSGFGGLEGRALRAGDTLSIGQPSASTEDLLGRRLVAPPPEYPAEIEVRVILGPQETRFTAEGIANLLGGGYRVSSRSDRMGVRLEGGPPITHSHGADLISEGIVPGSIQVPGDAQPIVLLAACATMGGYPKVATVIDADRDRLAQVRPGDRVRFTAVSREVALRLRAERHAALGEQSVKAVGRPRSRWSPSTFPFPGAQLSAHASVAHLAAMLNGSRFDEIEIDLKAGSHQLRLRLRRHSHPSTPIPDENP